MNSFLFYKTIHVSVVLLFFSILGGLLAVSPSTQRSPALIGARILCLLSGFGIFFSGLTVAVQMAQGFPVWVLVKGGIWIAIFFILMPLALGLFARHPPWRLGIGCAALVLALWAVYIAIHKPF